MSIVAAKSIATCKSGRKICLYRSVQSLRKSRYEKRHRIELIFHTFPDVYPQSVACMQSHNASDPITYQPAVTPLSPFRHLFALFKRVFHKSLYRRVQPNTVTHRTTREPDDKTPCMLHMNRASSDLLFTCGFRIESIHASRQHKMARPERKDVMLTAPDHTPDKTQTPSGTTNQLLTIEQWPGNICLPIQS